MTFEKFFIEEENVVFLDSPLGLKGASAIFYSEKTGQFFVIDEDGCIVRKADFVHKKFGLSNLKSLKNGFYLVQTKKPCLTYLLNEFFEIEKEINQFLRPWHGTSSIDEDDIGNILFSEYISTKDPKPKDLHVWKSSDGGSSWRDVLTLRASPAYGEGDIRHFHTCFYHCKSKTWFVSTGDKNCQNQLYESHDSGETWSRVDPVVDIPCGLIPKNEYRRALRFTSVICNDEGVIWATDDDLSIKRSGIFLLNEKGALRFLGFLGKNLVRSAIKLTNIEGKRSDDIIFLTECKSEKSGADIWHYSKHKNNVKHLAKIPSEAGLGNYPFTRSKASQHFINNKAYTYLDGFFDRDVDNARSLRLSVNFIKDYELNEVAKSKADLLESIGDRVIVFFHAQRTAGTTVKKFFNDIFGMENCLYQKKTSDYCKWSDIKLDVLKRYKIYAGHNNFSVIQGADELSWYFSTVRNPVDRILSLYYYLKKRPEHKLHKYAVNYDIGDFFEYSLEIDRAYVSNTQCRRISSTADFIKTMNVFEDRYGLLIPFESLDEGLKIINSYLSERMNVGEVDLSSGRTSGGDREVISDELRRRILEENCEDYALWLYVRNFYSEFKSLVRQR